MRKNKQDGICITCWKYERCGISDKARGMPYSEYGRKENKDGRNDKRTVDAGSI